MSSPHSESDSSHLDWGIDLEEEVCHIYILKLIIVSLDNK